MRFSFRFRRWDCAGCRNHRRPTGAALAACAPSRRAPPGISMMWIKLIFGGLGRRSVEAIAAAIILAATSATVAASLLVVEGARTALTRAVHRDRPDILQIKSRFNRALFETPRSGNLPPLTIPVYEPLIDPVELEAAAGNNELVKRQSLFRNVVSSDSFLCNEKALQPSALLLTCSIQTSFSGRL